MVWQAAASVSIPVVGMGGIMNADDAAQFMLAGARAVMIGTANISDPMAGPRILAELEGFTRANGIADVNELVGALVTS
jgi:dihydroorotate dehydrogenase (NAD+) catalytic subunit